VGIPFDRSHSGGFGNHNLRRQPATDIRRPHPPAWQVSGRPVYQKEEFRRIFPVGDINPIKSVANTDPIFVEKMIV
jgi:hypothetical protein